MNVGTWQCFSDKTAAACGLAAVAVVGIACASRLVAAGPNEPRRPINALCPVMTEEKVNPEFTTTFESRVIGFCCDKCLAKFEANPRRYAARVAELQDSKPQTTDADQPRHEYGEAQPARSQTQEADGTHAHNPAQNGGHADAHDHDQLEHEEPAAATHDHDHPNGQGVFARLIGWLGKFHPPTVNFPIAMILGAGFAELLLIATGRSFFVNAGRFCLWIGAIGALGAALLGWFFAGFHFVDDSWILTTHRWLGTTTAAWSVLLLVIGERTFRRADAKRTRYRAVLLIGAGLVGITGFFGGSLIYGLNHYVFWAGN